MNSSQVTHTMFNPFDGVTFATGTVLMSAFGIINGSSPVLATAVGALITGAFVLIAKIVELAWKSRAEKSADRKRIAELEAQLNGKQKNSLT